MNKPTNAAMRAAIDILPGSRLVDAAGIIDRETLLPECIKMLRDVALGADVSQKKARALLARLEKP